MIIYFLFSLLRVRVARSKKITVKFNRVIRRRKSRLINVDLNIEFNISIVNVI